MELGQKHAVMSELLTSRSMDWNLVEMLHASKLREDDHETRLMVFELEGGVQWWEATLVESALHIADVLRDQDPGKRYFVLVERVRGSPEYGMCLCEVPRLRERVYGPRAIRDWRLEKKSPFLKEEMWLQPHPVSVMCDGAEELDDCLEQARLGRKICTMYGRNRWGEARYEMEKALCLAGRTCWMCGDSSVLEAKLYFRARFVNGPMARTMALDLHRVCSKHYEIEEDVDDWSVFVQLEVMKETGQYVFSEVIRRKWAAKSPVLKEEHLTGEKVMEVRRELSYWEGDTTLELCDRIIGGALRKEYGRMMVLEFWEVRADEMVSASSEEVLKTPTRLYSVPSWGEVGQGKTPSYCVVFELEEEEEWGEDGGVLQWYKERPRFEEKNGWTIKGRYVFQCPTPVRFPVYCSPKKGVYLEMLWTNVKELLELILGGMMSLSETMRMKMNDMWKSDYKRGASRSEKGYLELLYTVVNLVQSKVKNRCEWKDERCAMRKSIGVEKTFEFEFETPFARQYRIVQGELKTIEM